MPSKSPAQARLMAGVAHSPKFAAKVGIPKKVGIDFNKADKGSGILKAAKNFSKPKIHAPKKATPLAMPMGDNRAGRLKPVATDRGAFRFKDNRAGE